MSKKKIINYRGFYLAVCETKENWTGTIYHNKFDSLRFFTNLDYYEKLHIEHLEDKLILKMKNEVDRFIEKKKKELEWQIEASKRKIEILTNDLLILGE